MIVDLVADRDCKTRGYVFLGVLVTSSSRAEVAISEVPFFGVPEITLCLFAAVLCCVCWSTNEIEKGSRGFSSCRKKLNAGKEYLGD